MALPDVRALSVVPLPLLRNSKSQKLVDVWIMYALTGQLRRGNNVARRLVSYVLGIETSCDDTGLAIVDTNGKVCANVLDSQQQFHTR